MTIVTNRLQPAVIGLCGHVGFVPFPRSLRKPNLNAKSSVPVHFSDSHSMWGVIPNVNWQVDAYLFTLSVRHMCRDRHGGGNLRFLKRLCAIINVLASSAGFVRSNGVGRRFWRNMTIELTNRLRGVGFSLECRGF